MTSDKKGWRTIPIGGIILKGGTARKYRTGDWRTFRPIIDLDKCIGCALCWIYCPEPAIEKEGGQVKVNYEYCKGCGICMEECPVKAITIVDEENA